MVMAPAILAKTFTVDKVEYKTYVIMNSHQYLRRY